MLSVGCRYEGRLGQAPRSTSTEPSDPASTSKAAGDVPGAGRAAADGGFAPPFIRMPPPRLPIQPGNASLEFES